MPRASRSTCSMPAASRPAMSSSTGARSRTSASPISGWRRSIIGRGLGRYLLNWAVDLAWSYGPQRLLVSTWSFDHPRAFANYQRAGFRPYKQARGKLLDPRLEGTDPGRRAAAPRAVRRGRRERAAPAAGQGSGPPPDRDHRRRLGDERDGGRHGPGRDPVAARTSARYAGRADERRLLPDGRVPGLLDLAGRRQARLRACTTYAEPGMRIRTTWPDRLLAS